VRLFAAARAAAGGCAATETEPGSTLAQALDQLTEAFGPAFGRVARRCSYLVDGRRTNPDSAAPLAPGQTLDLLPPFAGG
jgi:molybdopterin converting factor small subunit